LDHLLHLRLGGSVLLPERLPPGERFLRLWNLLRPSPVDQYLLVVLKVDSHVQPLGGRFRHQFVQLGDGELAVVRSHEDFFERLHHAVETAVHAFAGRTNLQRVGVGVKDVVGPPRLFQRAVKIVVVRRLDQFGDAAELLPVLRRKGLLLAQNVHEVLGAHGDELAQIRSNRHRNPSCIKKFDASPAGKSPPEESAVGNKPSPHSTFIRPVYQ
jgi:hypothetical protein